MNEAAFSLNVKIKGGTTDPMLTIRGDDFQGFVDNLSRMLGDAGTEAVLAKVLEEFTPRVVAAAIVQQTFPGTVVEVAGTATTSPVPPITVTPGVSPPAPTCLKCKGPKVYEEHTNAKGLLSGKWVCKHCLSGAGSAAPAAPEGGPTRIQITTAQNLGVNVSGMTKQEAAEAIAAAKMYPKGAM